jgi:hypothetical protein
MKPHALMPYAALAIVYTGFFLAYRALVPAIEQGYSGPRPEFRRFAKIQEEVRQQGEVLRDVLVRDSILPLIPSEAGIAAMLPDSGSGRTEYLRRIAQRESARKLEVAIPIIGVSVNYAIFPDIPQALSSSRYYAGVGTGGVPYCAVVIPFFRSEALFNTRSASLLGPCNVWARHGAAGRHIRQWMHDTRGQFAIDENSRVIAEYEETLFARQFGSQFRGTFESRRCRAGDRAACERAVIKADTSGGMPAGIAMTADRWYMPRVAPGDAGLLADLETQFGSERFQRFWKSPEPVEKAFEAAFGVALGQWVQDWSEARYGPITLGSRMKLETVLFSLIFIGLFTALAVATVRGRRI